jgi:hypothetical protein
VRSMRRSKLSQRLSKWRMGSTWRHKLTNRFVWFTQR